jgi:hypothetical protein
MLLARFISFRKLKMQVFGNHKQTRQNKQESKDHTGKKAFVFILEWSFKGIYSDKVSVDEPCSRLLEQNVDVCVVLRGHVIRVER